MNFYYDVLLNFCEDNIYDFYEWESNDPFDNVKKIPIFKVDNELIKDLLEYHLQVDSEFLKQIKNKTILDRALNKTIAYACILTDSKNSLAIELDSKGKVLCVSKLLIEDENNINEISYTLKHTNIKYELLSKRSINNELRQLKRIRKLISLELKTIVKEKNYTKLKYLYFEWFDITNNSIDKMLEDMNNDLIIISDKHFKIYEIIKESYKETN
ncbi:MAG: DUF3603 family protein [Bacilli bacterium]|nr:DUF3603 family protein [Bacilli bacterium]